MEKWQVSESLQQNQDKNETQRIYNKIKEAREECYAQLGIDELDKDVAENWQMWNNGSVKTIGLQNQDKSETQIRNKKKTKKK